jgi:putative ABC transport system permease protein
LRQDWLRTALMVIAVALGVAVVLAIDLAGTAAAGSFRSSVETLAGNADYEVTAIGGVPDDVLARLVTLPYPLRISPRIEDYATVADTGQTVPLVGIDMIGDPEPASRNGPPIMAPDLAICVWISAGLGRRIGESLRLLINDREESFRVCGFVPGRGPSEPEQSVIVMDMVLAVKVLGRPDRLDRILIRLPPHDGPSSVQWENTFQQVLPPGVQLRPEGARTSETRRMLAAFRWNLRVLSYISLIVGAFLIYNTMSVSVVRRRFEIGILRGIGATRRLILGAFMVEAAGFGLAGALLGLALGRVMAAGAVKLIGSTVESLYVSSSPAPIALSPGSVLLALVVGFGVSLIGGLAPAVAAARTSPVEAMARGRREYEVRVEKTRDLWIAALLGIAGAAATRLPPAGGKPLFGYLAALLLIGSGVFTIPAVASGLSAFTSSLLRRLMGVEALLAARSLASSLRRTSVLVAALSTAIAMMVSVGIMVGSFRKTVAIWMDNQLTADLFLRPAIPPAADRYPTLAPDLAARIAAVPGVAAVDRFRDYEISYEGLPATLGAGDSEVQARYGRTEFLGGASREVIFRQLARGEGVVVSEPFSTKHRVRAGDLIRLSLGNGPASFRVLGVYYDYSNERGTIAMDRNTLLRYLPDPAPSSIAIYLNPAARPDQVRQEVERACAGHRVAVFSSRALRRQALRVFDRTFAITYALEAIAIFVAIVGIAGALLALVVDRRRELSLLRFLGASARQVRRLILFEAGLLGLLSNLMGFALGVVLSLVLIFVINKQSFGWTIQFHWPVTVLVGGLSLVYAATLAAGIYPARFAARLNPIEVIHEE